MKALDLYMTPMHIDHAMEQTRLNGCKYIAIPLPWLQEWAEYAVDREGSRFQWWVVCMAGGNEGDIYRPELLDGNGNVVLCLLPRQHTGPCVTPGSS